MAEPESKKPFSVHGIDHVELFAPSRREAAAWYRENLGLEILPERADWARSDRGPLMISSDGGRTMLALFRGEPRGDRETAGFHRVAFRVNGTGFLDFLESLGEVHLRTETGARLTRADAVDHGGSFSIYFNDPWGHHLEVTTYDCEAVKAALP